MLKLKKKVNQFPTPYTFIFDFGSGLYCFYGSEWNSFSQHARFTWQCTAKRSMGCDKTGVSVYKRGSVGTAIVVWSGDGFSDTIDDLGMERSA